MIGECSDVNTGGVIWICGLSGVGKTTLAVEVERIMAAVHASVVRMDGDDFRRNFMPSAGYGREDRVMVARAIARQAWALAENGKLCVVATISLFSEIHHSNRAAERAYQIPFVQSLLSAPAPLLHERRASLMQSATNIVGVQITAELPTAPDHAFVNDGSIESLRAEAITLRDMWLKRRPLTARPAR